MLTEVHTEESPADELQNVLLIQTKTTNVGTPQICLLPRDVIKRGRCAKSHLHTHHITEPSECQKVQELVPVSTHTLEQREPRHGQDNSFVQPAEAERQAQSCVILTLTGSVHLPSWASSHAVSTPGCPESCKHRIRGSITVIRCEVTQ